MTEDGIVGKFVVERWWHRLLRVLMYASTCLVLAFAGMVQIDSSENYTYSYSYSMLPDYEQAEGEEHTCDYLEYSDSVSCGRFTSVTGLVELYSMVRDDKSSDSGPRDKYESGTKDKWREDPVIDEPSRGKTRYTMDDVFGSKSPNKPAKEGLASERLHAYNAVMNDLTNGKIHYKAVKHWQFKPLARSLELTLGYATGWFLFTFMIYKIILFIAYGHTRIRKA